MRKSLEERFWEKVDKNGPPHPTLPELGPCHLWVGAKVHGYGVLVAFDRRNVRATRVLFFLREGIELPRDVHVLHSCDNPPCVNWDHLRRGTPADNALDRLRAGHTTLGRKFPGRMPRGEDAGPSRLTEDAVRAIRAACAAGERQKDVAARFGVGQMTVSDIVRRATWAHVV